jgi:predicted lipid carrier protein YhbT
VNADSQCFLESGFVSAVCQVSDRWRFLPKTDLDLCVCVSVCDRQVVVCDVGMASVLLDPECSYSGCAALTELAEAAAASVWTAPEVSG